MTTPEVRQATDEDYEWAKSLVERRKHLACKLIADFDDWWYDEEYFIYVVPNKVIDIYRSVPDEDYIRLIIAFSEPEHEGVGYHHLICSEVERVKRARIDVEADTLVRAVDGLQKRGYELFGTEENYGSSNDNFIIMQADHRDGYEYDMEKLEL